mmetsp:Transcript_61775/g.172549  ORF Transcript_61775/g.172549 Transcript_61775/m.172549 type:complete len:227 (+) Transcript_61775:876-1556(+)
MPLRAAQSRELVSVLLVLVPPHLHQRLGRRLPVAPVRERHRELGQVLGQVPEAFQPLVDVGARQVAVVLVELAADEDGPLVVGIDLGHLPQGPQVRRVAGLLHAEDHVAIVLQERLVQLLDLGDELRRRLVPRKAAVARQVDDLHVHAAAGLDAQVDGFRGDVVAEVGVRLGHELLDLRSWPLLPLVGLAVQPVPLRGARHVAKLQHRRPAAAEGARDEIELLPRE